MAREKRPQYHHNYKAGAINSLLRVSSMISNAEIILILDCDMHSNHSQSVRDAICFFMDEEKGPEIAFVQFPQNFENISKNDLYGNALSVLMEVELHGADGYGGPLFIGTCCFHRRDALCGKKFCGQYKNDWNDENELIKANLQELEEESKALASCAYEENTLWGKEIGAIYKCLVEDVITGLWIQLQGWKSIYYNPPRKAFFGIAPTTLLHTLVQQRRWGEGELQISLSKYSPVWYGLGKINLGLLMGYCHYNYWVTTCLPILYYSIIPSLYLLKGIPLFPKMASPWFIPFTYVILGESTSSLIEGLIFGGTIQGWWNGLRMWLYVGTSSYLFAFIDIVLKFFEFSNSSFTITPKIIEDDVSQRYKKEIMEFGTSSPFFTVLVTLALLNLFCLLVTLKELVLSEGALVGEKMLLQVLLCGFLVFINFPIYQGLFLRRDKGRLPSSHTIKSTALALSACIIFKILKLD
ncbi:Cellulose synthase protein E1 [Spatholobus suberectus]|nr:Cellulose synthase protein E1 [Spatholobus suberectus]